MLLAAVALALQLHGEVLRIVVVGDIGDGTAEVARGIEAVNRREPIDAIITVGDNIYPTGVHSATDRRWAVLRPLASIGIPIFPTFGNHDHQGNAAAELSAPFPEWRFPGAEYAIHSPVADFAMLDTTPYAEGRAPPPDVAALFQGATAPWRIAVGHHPLLSSGWHGYLPRDEHRRMLRLIPGMRAAHVDLYLAGHDHHLELLRGRPMMLISGAGSQPIPPVFRRAQTIWANEGPGYRGFAVVEIGAKSIAIRFYDASGRPRSPKFEMHR